MEKQEVKDFIAGLCNGWERWFIWDGKRYCLFCWEKEGRFGMSLDQTEPVYESLVWFSSDTADKKKAVVKEFATEKIFDGKTFLEVAKDVKWIQAWE